MTELISAIALLIAACAGTTPLATGVPMAVPSLGDTGRSGDLTISDRKTLSGQVEGTLTVGQGGDLTLNGQVTGDLIVESGGRAEVLGMVLGDVVNRGGDVTVYGTVTGRIVDEGATTILIPGATVNGSEVP